jgi:hypothetical protein
MCTLLTLDRDTYLADKKTMTARILNDAALNPDGFSLVAVDPLASLTNLSLNCMAVGHILNLLDMFFAGASEYARIWLHTRAATTEYVGIPFNHGFTDSRGTIIQHNGVIRNYRNFAVDSFNLVDYRTDNAHALLADLETAMESFANIFLIRPDENTYGVVRVWTSTLFTDGNGNYSTNSVADILTPIPPGYAMEHGLLPTARVRCSLPEDDSYDTTSAWDCYTDTYSKTGG